MAFCGNTADERQSKYFLVQWGFGDPQRDQLPSGQAGRTLCQPSANATLQSRTSFAAHFSGEIHERNSLLPRAIGGAWFRLSRMGRPRQRIATGSGFARRPNAGWPDGGGREAQHSTLRTNSAPTSCLNLSSTCRLCSVPRAVLLQGYRSLHPLVSGDQI